MTKVDKSHQPVTLRAKARKYLNQQWRQWRGTILFFTFVVIPVKSSLADVNWVPTGSMNPTIVEGDMVCVNKMAYDLRLPLTLHSLKHRSDPQRGDIAVLFSPVDGTRLVKRVIGVPGDEIAMINNVVFLNGSPVSYSELPLEAIEDLESQLRQASVFATEELEGHPHAVMSIPSLPTEMRNFEALSVPKNHYFVMGDNRDNSLDSRAYGVVNRKQFVGRVSRLAVSFNILDKYQPRFSRFFKRLE